jgi:uncharacterized protein Yka (UPF0111/DUF47 family)
METQHVNYEWVKIGLSILFYLAGIIAAVARISYKLGKHEEKISEKLDEALKKHKDEVDHKISRIYSRFDEYKTLFESNFVRKEMCDVLHKNTASAVENFNKKIGHLEIKIDDLKTFMMQELAKIANANRN